MFAFGWLALAREWLETTLGDLGLPFDGVILCWSVCVGRHTPTCNGTWFVGADPVTLYGTTLRRVIQGPGNAI